MTKQRKMSKANLKSQAEKGVPSENRVSTAADMAHSDAIPAAKKFLGDDNRAQVQEQRDLESGKAADVDSEGVVDDGVRCLGITARKKQCSSKRKPDKKFCGRHEPPEKESVPMDAPPPTHQPLGSNT